MSPEALVYSLVWSNSIHSLLALALGFAVAGALSSGYQFMTLEPASFRLLHEGERNKALAAVPFLLFAAPFIIIRNTIRGRRIEGSNFGFAAMAAFLAGFWSLMSGSVVVMALEALGHLVA
jgi:O-antigen/teichoic acid export membrane protein